MVNRGSQITPTRSKFQQTDREAATQTKGGEGDNRTGRDKELLPSPGGYVTAEELGDIIEEKVLRFFRLSCVYIYSI